MEIKKCGEIIKFLRKSKGMAQNELAGDYLSVRQLQRIEKGESNPSTYTFVYLLTKLGEDSSKYYFNFANMSEEKIHNLTNEIEFLISNYRYEEAKEKYNLLKEIHSLNDRFILQFSLRCEMIFFAYIDKNYDEALIKAFSAIKVTHKNFQLDLIDRYFFIEQEYLILNTMALIYLNYGDTNKGIDILFKLRALLQQKHIPNALRLSLLPTICYNLSKYLGLQKRYEEAILVCDEGIDISSRAKTTKNVGGLYYNKAYDLYYLGCISKAEENFLFAYKIFMFEKNINMAEIVKENAINKYGIQL